MRSKTSRSLRFGLIAFFAASFVCVVIVRDLQVSAKESVPRVQLHTDNLGPREIEDLTSKSVPRDYALAWQTLEQALAENRQWRALRPPDWRGLPRRA